MIASLNQSDMITIGGGLRHDGSRKTRREDVRDARRGVEADVVPLAAPDVGFLREEILGLDGRVERQFPVEERQLDVAVLHVERIEIDDDQDRVAATGLALSRVEGGPLREADQLLVVRRVELEAVIELQRLMRTADRVDARDHCRQALRLIEVARANL